MGFCGSKERARERKMGKKTDEQGPQVAGVKGTF